MAIPRPAKDLDERIIEQDIGTNLDEALSRRGAKYLYVGKGLDNHSYKIDNGKIIKFWESSYAGGEPVTKREVLTREEFLGEVKQLPYDARLQIHLNLASLVQHSTLVQTKKEESRIPRNLFGY